MLFYDGQSAVASAALRTGAGKLRTISVTNVSGSTRYLWLFDNAAAASGNKVIAPRALDAGETRTIEWDANEAPEFENGLFAASSTTHGTFTQSVGNDFFICAHGNRD